MAIDANLEMAEEEDCYDVFGYLKKLRQSRKGMIENVVSGLKGNNRFKVNLFFHSIYRFFRNSTNSYTTHWKSTQYVDRVGFL